MEKELTKEKQIAILKGTRVLSRRGVIGKKDIKLSIGDLVYDEKNREYGILLGVKPMIVGGTGDEIAKKAVFDGIPLQTFPQANTCIVMTLSKDERIGAFTSRIRYTNSKWLNRIENMHEEVQNLSDLDVHCQSECFLECSPECSLWKYKKK